MECAAPRRRAPTGRRRRRRRAHRRRTTHARSQDMNLPAVTTVPRRDSDRNPAGSIRTNGPISAVGEVITRDVPKASRHARRRPPVARSQTASDGRPAGPLSTQFVLPRENCFRRKAICIGLPIKLRLRPRHLSYADNNNSDDSRSLSSKRKFIETSKSANADGPRDAV